jgi:hypothetical protein
MVRDVLSARRSVLLAFACAMALLCPASARAAGSVGGAAGMFRCVAAHGAIPGGRAELDVCVFYGPATSAASDGGNPSAHTAQIGGYLMVMTSKGLDFRVFAFDPLTPPAPNVGGATALTMDPAMQTGKLVLRVATVTASIDLTAAIAAPDAWNYLRAGEEVDRGGPGGAPRACAAANADIAAFRPATVSGVVISSKRGGGALSDANGWMAQGVAAGAELAPTAGCVFGPRV